MVNKKKEKNMNFSVKNVGENLEDLCNLYFRLLQRS